jgi:hypothetical protein
MMSNLPIYAAAAAFACALVALLVYHVAVVRPALAAAQRLLATHDQLIAGGSGSAAGRLGKIESTLPVLEAGLDALSGRTGELEALAKTDLSRVGFVRYDAFDDTGSNLSYALALLNREGDGIVLSSLYSRSDTRTYGKAVQAFKPAANASEEELQAIAIARGGGSGS